MNGTEVFSRGIIDVKVTTTHVQICGDGLLLRSSLRLVFFFSLMIKKKKRVMSCIAKPRR